MRAEKKNMALIAARAAAGKTQLQVAREARINERVYQNYEYNESEPAARTAIRIAGVVGSTVEALWGGNPTG